jgi:hypothetical protein
VIRETAGVAVTINSETHRFDGAVVSNRNGMGMSVPANGTVTIRRRWCSATATEHTTQTTMTGTDASGNAVTLTSAETKLLKP